MSINVKNLQLNYDNCARIAKRVMRDNNMHIASKFVPSDTSVYTFKINPKKHVMLYMCDDYFSYSEFSKVGEKWDVSKSYDVKGSIKLVESAFCRAVKKVNRLLQNGK